jgi:hypothetical protein
MIFWTIARCSNDSAVGHHQVWSSTRPRLGVKELPGVNASLDGSKVFARVKRDLAMQPDLTQAMGRLVHVSTQLTGCDVAAVWELQHGTRVALRSCNDDVTGRILGKILTDVDEGPARQALSDQSTCVVGDLDNETRWPPRRLLRHLELPSGVLVTTAIPEDHTQLEQGKVVSVELRADQVDSARADRVRHAHRKAQVGDDEPGWNLVLVFALLGHACHIGLLAAHRGCTATAPVPAFGETILGDFAETR